MKTIFFILALMFCIPAANAQYTGVTDEFVDIDEYPRFPGCKSRGDDDDVEILEECAERKLHQFIFSNMEYPVDSKAAGVEGSVIVIFGIDKKGKLLTPKITKKLNDECDAEVLRLLKMMPQKWVPGKHEGKSMKVEYQLTVRFRL